MANPKYADLESLRHAIRQFKQVRFRHYGTAYLVEPHGLEISRDTDAMMLVAWVIAGGASPGWKFIPFGELRELEIQCETFAVRHDLPAVRRMSLLANSADAGAPAVRAGG